MIRDPVELMYSFHSHRLRPGNETIADFAKPLEAEEDRKRGNRIPPGCKVAKALYYRELVSLAPQIQRYLELFSRQDIKFIVHDDLVVSSTEVYRGVLEFLGVDADFQLEFGPVNAHKAARSSWLQELRNNATILRVGRRVLPQVARRRLVSALYVSKSRPGMDPELRHRLTAEFAPEVERLSELIGRDLTVWSKAEVTTARS